MNSSSGAPVVLVHGGLYEDVDAARFWGATGIGPALRSHGFAVVAPNRPLRPVSWEQARDALVAFVTSRMSPPVGIVAASNGCSVALRAVIDWPGVARRLVLCWPATAGDARIDAATRQTIMASAGRRAADRLLAGDAIRGVLDRELESIDIPVTVVPSEPEDLFHQPGTVDVLRRTLPNVRVTAVTPPALRPNFRDHRARFIDELTVALT